MNTVQIWAQMVHISCAPLMGAAHPPELILLPPTRQLIWDAPQDRRQIRLVASQVQSVCRLRDLLRRLSSPLRRLPWLWLRSQFRMQVLGDSGYPLDPLWLVVDPLWRSRLQPFLRHLPPFLPLPPMLHCSALQLALNRASVSLKITLMALFVGVCLQIQMNRPLLVMHCMIQIGSRPWMKNFVPYSRMVLGVWYHLNKGKMSLGANGCIKLRGKLMVKLIDTKLGWWPRLQVAVWH